jgi:hypothetical protein
MRYPFTDRWNSLWHFLFGMVAVYIPFIIPLFLIYQGIQGKPNDLIDVLEFICGFGILMKAKEILLRNKM